MHGKQRIRNIFQSYVKVVLIYLNTTFKGILGSITQLQLSDNSAMNLDVAFILVSFLAFADLDS